MKLITFLLVIAPFITFSQDELPIPTKDGRFFYEVVSDSISLNKNELFAGSKKWLSEIFANADRSIQTEDIETGQIVAKGAFKVNNFKAETAALQYDIIYTIQMDCRDGKYRFRVYDIRYYPSSASRNAYPFEGVILNLDEKKTKRVLDVYSDTNDKILLLIDSYKKTVVDLSNDQF